MNRGYLGHYFECNRTFVVLAGYFDGFDIHMPLWCLLPFTNEAVTNTLHQVRKV